MCVYIFQGDAEMKQEFDDDGMMDANGASGDNSMISPSGLPNPGAKPKAPRVKKEKKEPGKNNLKDIPRIQLFPCFLKYQTL